jgi:hypothetical protein
MSDEEEDYDHKYDHLTLRVAVDLRLVLSQTVLKCPVN